MTEITDKRLADAAYLAKVSLYGLENDTTVWNGWKPRVEHLANLQIACKEIREQLQPRLHVQFETEHHDDCLIVHYRLGMRFNRGFGDDLLNIPPG